MKPGDTFGEWTVLEMTGAKWTGRSLCRCSCGTERKVHNLNLMKGKSKSCGGCKRSEVAAKSKKFQNSVGVAEAIKSNSTGYKGVVDLGHSFQAKLSVGGFRTAKEAHEMYVALKTFARKYERDKVRG